jgi:hypothetical protein
MNTQQLLGLLVSTGLLMALITTGIKGLNLLGTLADAKAAEVASKQKNATLQRYLLTAENAIEKAVMTLAQKTADSLKEKAADGKLTEAEQQALKKEATDLAVQMMGVEAHNGLNQIFGDASAWIDATIDTYARKAKKSKTTISVEPTPLEPIMQTFTPEPEQTNEGTNILPSEEKTVSQDTSINASGDAQNSLQETIPVPEPIIHPAEMPTSIPDETIPQATSPEFTPSTPTTEGDA